MTKISLPLASSSWNADEIEAIQRVIKSDHYTMGKEVSDFEQQFANYFGSKYAVMVNSGSSANLLAIAALQFKSESPLCPGDEVIVPSLSWPTTFCPVDQNKMKLVFVDIDIDTLNISVDEILKAITSKTKAIFVPNILGNAAELDKITKICEENNLYLIEDNCESMGAQLDSRYCGTFGIMGTFSCFFSHHISTMEGGVIVTDDAELYEILIALRSHGWTRHLPKNSILHQKSDDKFYELFNFILPGYNLRPLEFSGAIGQEQLKKLPGLIEWRQKNAAYFVELFANHSALKIQKEIGQSSWFGFSLLVDPQQMRRSEVLTLLSDLDCEVRPIISGNFLRHKAVKYLDHRVQGEHPNANYVHDNGFFIGNHHHDIRKNLDEVFNALK